MRLRSLLGQVRIPQSLPILLGKYVYQPLPTETSIRLLELAPSTNRRKIICSLKTFELQDAPSFRALSYTWGHSQIAINKVPRPIKENFTQSAISRGDVRTHKLEDDTETVNLARRHHIICDGRWLKVTGNLRDALLMLSNSMTMASMPRTPTYYWVDALCVDQKNVLERNLQVARMADIFHKASNVVVWLGKEDDFTKDALIVIHKVSTIPKSSWSLVPYTSFYEPQANHDHKPSLTYHNWLGFIALVNRPWFRRAWVVQEITLGKSPLVVCGTQVFAWEKLSKTLSFIKATRWYHHLHTEKMKHLVELQSRPGNYKHVLQAKLSVGFSPLFLNETRVAVCAAASPAEKAIAQRPPFMMLLNRHRFTKSTDPRDKVYAFLGLASTKMAPFRTMPTALMPDYNMSVQKVYLETAKVLLSTYRNLSLLSHVEDASIRRTTGLPSWVPDYSVSLEPYPLRYRGNGMWKASGYLPWRMSTVTMESGMLDVQGYLLDHIDQTSTLLDESSDPSTSWASIVKLALSLDLPYPDPSGTGNRRSRVEVLWRTLTTDTYAHMCPAPLEAGLLFLDYILNLQVRHRLVPWASQDAFQPHHSPLSASIYPEWRTLLSLEPAGSAYTLDAYKKRLTTVVDHMFNGDYSPIGLAQLQHELDQSGGTKRRLFKTQCGYLGTGPRSLEPGDEVWILHRGGLPFVLRPQPKPGHYRLVGEAFVYGVMSGEALALGLRVQNITIV